MLLLWHKLNHRPTAKVGIVSLTLE
jgi:hypothetical protein